MARTSYFKGVECLEDVREKLIENLRSLDPKSQRFETMIEQYQKSCVKLCDKRKSKAGKIYDSKKRVAIPPKEFASLMHKILSLDGITSYRDGAWMWFKGETKKHSKELAAIGKELRENGYGSLKFSDKRKEWYFKDYEVA